MSKKALGKGLSALIDSGEDGDVAVIEKEGAVPVEINVQNLSAGVSQPREYFSETSLQELADSIQEKGILQPIIVRKSKEKDNNYEIIAGERRYRAAKIVGLKSVPVIIHDIDDKQAAEIAIIENIQRENLTPTEEANSYKKLQDEFNYTQEQVAKILGKSRSHLANMLRLLTLPDSVKEMLDSGTLSMGHARVLVGMGDEAEFIAKQIVQENLNVRDTEKLSNKKKKSTSRKNKTQKTTSQVINSDKDEDLLVLENSLSESLGLKVHVEDSAEGGKVVLYFNNLTELDKILQRIG